MAPLLPPPLPLPLLAGGRGVAALLSAMQAVAADAYAAAAAAAGGGGGDGGGGALQQRPSAASPSSPLLPAAAAAHWQQCQQARLKHTVRMVLLEDHPKLGRRGDLVTVKAGHARYTLFPRGQADYAVPSVLRSLQARGVLSEQALERLRLGRAGAGAAAAAVDPAALPLEQQLPVALQRLAQRPLVVSRRYSQRHGDERPMVGSVTAGHLAAAAAKQLGVHLPRELICMADGARIDGFGSFRVPLNLRGADGAQLELGVTVRRTLRSSGVGRMRRLLDELDGGGGGGDARQAPKGAGAAAAAGAADGDANASSSSSSSSSNSAGEA